MQLPKTPAPQSKDDWIYTFFQLSGVNPLLVLLSDQSSKSNVYHRTYRLALLLLKKLSSDSLPTFHFGLANSKFEYNKSRPLHSSTDTATAVMSTKSKTYKYLIIIYRVVKNDLTFMICDYPQTQLPTNNLYSDSNINKRKWLGFYLNIRGTGIIGHTTPRIKGSSDENINNDKSMYEPALLIAKNGIFSYITKDTIKVMSLSKTTDSSPSIVQYDFAIPTTTNHGKVKYHCNQTNSYNLNLSIPKLTGYKLKKVYSIQDKPQTKQEAWLYHILRIKAKLNSRYIYVTNRIQLLALLDDLYAFIIPSTSVPSEFNILSTKTKTRILLPKIKDYLDKNIKDPFLKRFSPKILAHLLKSNLRHHLRNEIQNLWNTLVNARLEFSNLLIMLLSDEVFGSGLLPAGTQPEEN